VIPPFASVERYHTMGRPGFSASVLVWSAASILALIPFAAGPPQPLRCRQRRACPDDEFVGLVEQPLRHAPESEIDGAALLGVVERREGFGLLEYRPVLLVDPEVKRVLRHHAEHHPIAEHAGLAEHAPQGDAAERRELLVQEIGKIFAGDHGAPFTEA